MFSRRATITSTGNYSEQIRKLSHALYNADALVIGAGAGLSAAAGFAYDGKRFHESFADFEAKYGFHDMYTGGFYPYLTPEEFWAGSVMALISYSGISTATAMWIRQNPSTRICWNW